MIYVYTLSQSLSLLADMNAFHGLGSFTALGWDGLGVVRILWVLKMVSLQCGSIFRLADDETNRQEKKISTISKTLACISCLRL